MTPSIFYAVNVPAVQAVLKTGTGPLRFYMFGLAPKEKVYPYAVWAVTGGRPENYVQGAPDADNYSIQIDVYASPDQGPSVARNALEKIQTAIESVAYVTSYLGEDRDPETLVWATGIVVDWIENR